MKKCDCYCESERLQYSKFFSQAYMKLYSYCNGTRERDECSCGGDRTKCDFYPEVREKALKEQEPKFGKWISVKDRLPDKDGTYLCFYDAFGIGCIKTYEYSTNLHKLDKYDFPYEKGGGFFSYDGEWGYAKHNNITHWMPLPEPPKGE